MIIQTILVIASLVAFVYFLTNRNSTRVRAYKKIGLFIFILLMVVFILLPEKLNQIAKLVGVGRGADLLLYVFFVMFVIFSINVYMKFKDQEDKIHRLSRKIAIIEAKERVLRK